MSHAVPKLAADGLLLRGWRDGDAADVLAMAADAQTRAWTPSLRSVHTEADARAWMDRRRPPGKVDWAVCDAGTGELVGRVGLHGFDDDSRSAEVGYVVLAPHRGKGVARRAVAAAAGHAFGPLGLARVSLVHAVGNPASCGVATGSGFAFEGVERAALDHGDGVLHDVHRHARLATDPPGPAKAAPQPLDPVEIAAGRFQLRPPSEAEAADALAMLRDPAVRQWNPAPQVVDLETARAWCRSGADWSQGTHATFSVLDATTGRLLGNVSLWGIDLADQRSALVGYRTAPWARGQGVAPDGVDAVTRWAFGALGVERIGLPHAVANPASCRVAEKCGYRLEGTSRKAFRDEDGVRHDEHLHARLATD